MNKYYVKSMQGWFVVNCQNKGQAKSEGIFEYGRGNVQEVRLATQHEIETFVSNKGERALEPSL